MFVRWIGAFRKHEGGVLDSISFEMGREDPAACERITRNSRTEVFARVGLAVKPDHVYRNFQSDVWSVYTEEGQLKKTRNESTSRWKESWCKPGGFDAIVISTGWWTLRKNVREDIKLASAEFGLRILQLKKDKVQDITSFAHCAEATQ